MKCGERKERVRGGRKAYMLLELFPRTFRRMPRSLLVQSAGEDSENGKKGQENSREGLDGEAKREREEIRGKDRETDGESERRGWTVGCCSPVDDAIWQKE